MKINKNAYAAGVLIGLCSYIYASGDNYIVGAFLFGLGLVTICAFKLELFTGKVGASCDIEYLTNVLVYNFLGVMTIRLIMMIYPNNPLSLGIICGMLMQIGVASYDKNQFMTIMCVAAFLLSGAKHCIAMMYYPLTPVWFLVVIGNILGAKFIYYLGVK